MFLLMLMSYLAIGLVAGIIGGLLGIGGGVITIPAFFLIFQWLGYPASQIMHLSIGTSLAAMVLNTIAATHAHHQRNAVLWPIFGKMTPGLIIGSICGALIATLLSGHFLAIFFGVFLCLLSLNFLRGKVLNLGFTHFPDPLVLNLVSVGIGTLSSILGIGGGVLTVPFLLACHFKDTYAIGTSAATTVLVSLLGTCAYIFFGWTQTLGPENLGYVNLPAGLIVGLMSFFIAPYGVKLAHFLSPAKVRKIFAFILILTGMTFITLSLVNI